MPLDAQTQAFVDQVVAAGATSYADISLEVAREAEYAWLELAGPAAQLASVEDRRIPGPDGELTVRVYTPEGESPFPLLVYFHGGGWVVGDLETMDRVARLFARESGCVVVSVEYRVAPEHRFPAAAEDCYAATRYVSEHAAEFGGDASRLAVAGDSAGGNLAAVVALMARDRGGPPIAYQVLIYPVIDYAFDTPSYRDNAEGYLLSRRDMEWFWAQYLGSEGNGHDPYASPIRAVSLAGLPPALVQTAEFDPLRDEGEAYAARLREAGVPVTLTRYDGTIHAYLQIPTVVDQGRRAIEEIGATLRAALAATSKS